LGAWMFVCCECCCQIEVSATSWSLVQRSPTDCGVLCDQETSRKRRPWSALGRSATEKKGTMYYSRFLIVWTSQTNTTKTYFGIYLKKGTKHDCSWGVSRLQKNSKTAKHFALKYGQDEK